MNYNVLFYKNASFIVLGILIIFSIIICISSKNNILNNLNFKNEMQHRSNLLQEGLENRNNNVQEGFTSKYKPSKLEKDNDIFSLIDRKLKALTQEIGGNEGKNEIKEILKNSKKICNLECAKCMMNMIEDKKGMKSIDFENLFDDENDDNCIKCKKYTELSSSLQGMIDSL